MTPQVAFNKVYEPCVYGTVGSPSLRKELKNLNEILNQNIESGNQVVEEILEMLNVWLVKRDNAQEYEHPTQKPITLCEKPMKRCTKAGDIVLDLFGGSGSTLIAAELENVLDLVTDAWNYFPHKTLGGISPSEKMTEHHGKEWNSSRGV